MGFAGPARGQSVIPRVMPSGPLILNMGVWSDFQSGLCVDLKTSEEAVWVILEDQMKTEVWKNIQGFQM